MCFDLLCSFDHLLVELRSSTSLFVELRSSLLAFITTSHCSIITARVFGEILAAFLSALVGSEVAYSAAQATVAILSEAYKITKNHRSFPRNTSLQGENVIGKGKAKRRSNKMNYRNSSFFINKLPKDFTTHVLNCGLHHAGATLHNNHNCNLKHWCGQFQLVPLSTLILPDKRPADTSITILPLMSLILMEITLPLKFSHQSEIAKY
ncbi:hypothetical protein Ahy_A02g006269 [Arachis hypogaea]|uniref:Uncharacterized protein n=1 Tax=Arachis hypogaea TaxID=3818 RepID=A0A445E9R8_ARAHY|nr:hypothetical protein Ahy_A02g006269 [Arachis hypogaea]